MNDSEFIELLNLYLDHEISADAAARLEAEVAQHPARRRLYRQYCRMHKACTLLAAAAPAPAEADEKVVVLDRRPSFFGGRYATGLLAVAAAVAVAIFYRHQPVAAPAASSAPMVAVAAPAARPAAVLGTTDEMKPVFTSRAFAAGAAGGGPLWPGADLAWINSVQLAPMPPPMPPPQSLAETNEAKSVPAAFGAVPAEPTAADLTAFRFEK